MAEYSDGKRSGNRHRVPHVEIVETSEAVVLSAEMPGVRKEDLDVNIDGGELTIKGKRGSTNSGLKLVRGESDKADFLRVFTLGEALDTSNVNAKLDSGILTLTLHKKPEILPRKIEVEVV